MEKANLIKSTEFWLNYPKESNEDFLKAIDAGAAKLQAMVLWFWGLYTSAFTLGVSINYIKAPLWVLASFVSPIVLLILSYWYCVFAQLPVIVGLIPQKGYDPTKEDDIRKEYDAGLKRKYNRLKGASFLTFISALFLGIALSSLPIAKKETPSASIPIEVMLNDKKDELILSGFLPKDIFVNTVVDSLDSPFDSSDTSERRIIFYRNSYRIQANGILNLNIPVRSISEFNRLCITTTWKENNEIKGFVRYVTK